MIVYDDILRNFDRRYRNFGVIRNVETLECCMDANRQLRLVDDYPWFDPAALEGFVDEAVTILGENPALADRLDAVAEAVRWRIGRILAVL